MAFAGCATSGTAPVDARWLAPAQAVQLAADAAPRGVKGVFALQVRATGRQGEMAYLNSETDYRDQRNLSIALEPQAVRQLGERLGADPLEALKGRRILVDGEARRTTIVFYADGVATDKYYYQTQVRVTRAEQITVQ
ncbi:hypothetical protein H0E82_03740 [Luteimonas sp. SJ-16]|uniref:Uncharacterized protein n=1 Tax=Luteimonas deserti TaxID=2752306 RepID=A0A7Z0TV48_9GAMM|nr:hypothetical protein [Luteimonas deserti]